MALLRLVTLVLLMLIVPLAGGCSQERRDDIRSEISDRASGSTLPSEVPSSEAPTSEAPTSEAPTSEAPTSEAPTSEAPTSEAPTSEAPTSEAPTSEAPTSEAPTSEAPTSEPPASADEEAESAADAPPSEDEPIPWWWFALAAALLVLGLVVLLVARSRRAAAALADRTREALDRATELSMHLAATSPAALPGVAAQDSGRLANLAAELDEVLRATKEPSHREALGAVRGQVDALHRVVDGIALTGDQSPATAARLQEAAAALHTTSGQARALLQPAAAG